MSYGDEIKNLVTLISGQCFPQRGSGISSCQGPGVCREGR